MATKRRVYPGNAAGVSIGLRARKRRRLWRPERLPVQVYFDLVLLAIVDERDARD